MENKKNPGAALLWSFACPGFGQLYNRDYLIGLTLLALELVINLKSNLNLALLYTYHGYFLQAHDVANFEWGLLYPSLWSFGMWQAYNRAKEINTGYAAAKRNLTGLFFGLVAGMNMGLILNIPAFHSSLKKISMLTSPVVTGLLLGVLGAFIGHQIQKKWVK